MDNPTLDVPAAATLSGNRNVRTDIKVLRERARQEDLVAERIAIESYREMILFIGERDPTDAPAA